MLTAKLVPWLRCLETKETIKALVDQLIMMEATSFSGFSLFQERTVGTSLDGKDRKETLIAKRVYTLFFYKNNEVQIGRKL